MLGAGTGQLLRPSKVLDGFTVADTLVIKAQVQVILDKPGRPFRCLDAQYRRELVRVYLTNVESICRRFCDDKRARLAWLKSEAAQFREWWEGLSPERQRRLTAERGEVVLKGVVKQFFNEKEVTSTLVMDALYAGCRQLEEASRSCTASKTPGAPSAPNVVIRADRNIFTFGANVLEIAERSACPDWIPPYREDKGVLGADGLVLRSGGPESGPECEARRDSVDRDERRLGELGKRTVEMLAIAHIFCEKLETEFRQHQALKRQEELIAEEEEAGRLEDERQAAKQQAEKEKRAKKKEKQKKRKEEERAKKQAEEEERQRVEDERRREAEARAEERRRQEQEEREREAEAAAVAARERQRQKQQQQQQATTTAPGSSGGKSARSEGGGPAAAGPSNLRSHVLSSQDRSGSTSPDCSSSEASDSSSQPAPSSAPRRRSPRPPVGEAVAGAAAAAPAASGSRVGVVDAAGARTASGAAPSALSAELDAHKRRVAELEDQVAILEQHNRMFEVSASSSGRQLGDLQRQVAELSRALSDRERAIEAERRRSAGLQQQLQERDALIAELRRSRSSGGGGPPPASAPWTDSPARPSSSGSSIDAGEHGDGGDGAAGPAKGYLNGTGAAWGGGAAAAAARAGAVAVAAAADGEAAGEAPDGAHVGPAQGAAAAAGRGAPASYSEAAGGARPGGAASQARAQGPGSPSTAPVPQPGAQPAGDLSIGPSAALQSSQQLVRAGSAGATTTAGAGPAAPAAGFGGRTGKAVGAGVRYGSPGGSGGGAGASTVSQNGIAGVLHSTVPAVPAHGPVAAPSYRNAAAGGAAARSSGGSGSATIGLTISAAPGMAVGKQAAGAARGGGAGDSPFPGFSGATVAQQHGPAAGRAMAFGPMPGGVAKAGVQAPRGGGVAAAPAASPAHVGGDDGGAEFLHMSMIDSLLQE